MRLLVALAGGFTVYLIVGLFLGVAPRFQRRSRPRRQSKLRRWLIQVGSPLAPTQFLAASVGTGVDLGSCEDYRGGPCPELAALAPDGSTLVFVERRGGLELVVIDLSDPAVTSRIPIDVTGLLGHEELSGLNVEYLSFDGSRAALSLALFEEERLVQPGLVVDITTGDVSALDFAGAASLIEGEPRPSAPLPIDGQVALTMLCNRDGRDGDLVDVADVDGDGSPERVAIEYAIGAWEHEASFSVSNLGGDGSYSVEAEEVRTIGDGGGQGPDDPPDSTVEYRDLTGDSVDEAILCANGYFNRGHHRTFVIFSKSGDAWTVLPVEDDYTRELAWAELFALKDNMGFEIVQDANWGGNRLCRQKVYRTYTWTGNIFELINVRDERYFQTEDCEQFAEEVPQAGGSDDTPDGPPFGTWTVVLFSLDKTEFSESSAQNLAEAFVGIDAGVLLSDSYPSLNPGYWVVYTGEFDTEDEASAQCQSLQSLGVDCYQRFLDTN